MIDIYYIYDDASDIIDDADDSLHDAANSITLVIIVLG